MNCKSDFLSKQCLASFWTPFTLKTNPKDNLKYNHNPPAQSFLFITNNLKIIRGSTSTARATYYQFCLYLLFTLTPENASKAGGGIDQLFFQKWGETGVEVPFHNSIIDNFMIYQGRPETSLLQIFAHPKIQNSFL